MAISCEAGTLLKQILVVPATNAISERSIVASIAVSQDILRSTMSQAQLNYTVLADLALLQGENGRPLIGIMLA